jgi:uncharacterized membrane protein YczE
MTARASPPRLRRVDTAKLVLFAVRHTVGVGIFLWLTVQMHRLVEGWLWLPVGLLGIAYAVFATVAWTRLRAFYKRRAAGGDRPWK